MIEEKDVNYFVNKVISNFRNDLKQYEPDWDLPYILFGSLALLVNDQIKVNKQDNIILDKAVNLLEEMVTVEDNEVNDLLMVGFFEVFADEKTSLDYAKTNMNLKINDCLHRILR